MTEGAGVDVLVIGAGPTGLASAIELQRAGYSHRVVEKGCLVHSLFHFPTQMVYFTTAERLEIGGYPLICQGDKPTRIDALKYYRRVAEAETLQVRTYEKVVGISGRDGEFMVRAERVDDGAEQIYAARKIIVAVGNYDHPNRLGVPGEELPKVSHYFTEAHAHHGRDVVVIGGGNSAAEAALDLFRGGARVTLVHRRAEPSPGLKYWVAPDLKNRIQDGEIAARFLTDVVEIRPGSVRLRSVETGALDEIPNDFVFALIGFHPDVGFLERLGIAVDPDSQKPAMDPDTLESNVPGIYLAGVVISGREGNKIFIENGRFHGEQIVRGLRGVLTPSHAA
jgi:thioredoxin reductase (NADPH)